MSQLLDTNGEVGAELPSTNYKVLCENHCPFCGKGILEPCSCFATIQPNGKIKPECEGCSG